MEGILSESLEDNRLDRIIGKSLEGDALDCIVMEAESLEGVVVDCTVGVGEGILVDGDSREGIIDCESPGRGKAWFELFDDEDFRLKW